MKNFRSKIEGGLFKSLIAGLLLCVLVWPSSALAYESDDERRDGEFSPGACIKKGGQDWLGFLRAMAAADSFNETYLQPWVDVFGRNQCHSVALLNLIAQADHARSTVRDSFLSCNTEKAADAQKKFYKLTAEIYYVRHVVAEKKSKGYNKDIIENHPLEVAKLFKPKDQLYNEMKERYVGDNNNLFTEEEFELVFNEIVDRNINQRESFLVCDKGSWQQAAEKLAEFKAHFTEDLGGLKEFGENVAGEWQNIVNEAKTMKIVALIGGQDKAVGEFFKSFIDVSVNGNPDLEYFGEEFVEELKKQTPNWTQQTIVSQKDFIQSVESSAAVFALFDLEKEMKSNFATLYGTTGDETIELFLDTLDGRGKTQNQKDTEGTIEVLTAAFPLIDKVGQDLDSVGKKQCSE